MSGLISTRLRLLVTLLAVAVATGSVATAQPALDLAAPLAFDPAVRTGTLANGLRYYVRANSEPEGRAELRLAVDAGSVLEREDQRGLAHLLEHMAFNGTERFAEPELVRYLESVGTRFGPDLNAYTSFDETVYLLQVPTDSAVVFSTGLDVLREWAGRMTLADSSIERERGVVLEEWRLGQGANERMNREQLPVIYGGSRYAERLPIGLPDVIRTASPDAIRDFYRDWYRPDLMAVVVVGDVDVDAVEAQIRERFGSLDRRPGAPARQAFTVPEHAETRFAIATDAEASQTIVQILFKQPPTRTRTVGDVREELVHSLFFAALGARIDEIPRQPGAPFAAAFAGGGGDLRTLDSAYLVAFAGEARIADAVRVLTTEAERVRRHGVTQTELDRQKTDLLRSLRSAVAERDNQPSRNLAQAYVDAFLEGEPVVTPERRLELAEALIAGITRAEVDAVADELVTAENRVVVVSAPEKDGLAVPTEADLSAILADVARAEIEPYDDAVSDGPLVATPPAAGRITAETTDAALGTTTWTLSNGARVVLKPTAFKADEILLQATSPGGLSLLSDADLAVAGGAAGFVASSGVGTFDEGALQKKLSGQIVQVRPVISDRTEGFSGRAAPGDIEALFQLAHLYATAPRKDPGAFAASLDQTRTFLANQAASPRSAFQDTLSVTLADYNPRVQTLRAYLAGLGRADLDRSFAFYQDRFADASDFTFVLVGAFEPDAVRPLVEAYLASLPGTGRRETARDILITPPMGVVSKTVRAGSEPQAQVAVVFHSRLDVSSRAERTRVAATVDVLSKMLRENLREDRGGVYGVGVRPVVTRDPVGQVQVRVEFGADPERVEELVAAVFAEVERLKSGGAAPEHLAAFKEQQRRGQETNLQDNGYWMSVLVEAARRDEPAAEALAADRLAAAVTDDDVARTARAILDTGRYVRVTLLPAGD